MKKILAVIHQFLIEILIIILVAGNFVVCILERNSLQNTIIESLILYAILMIVITIMKPAMVRCDSKKVCTILHLTKKNTINMIPKKFDDEKQFISDIAEILTYAQQNNIRNMQTITHKIMVLYFLCEYTSYSKKEIYNMIGEMKEKEHLNLNTSFGSVEIIYMGKGINNCNRYNKSKKGLSKIVEVKDIYQMEIYLK